MKSSSDNRQSVLNLMKTISGQEKDRAQLSAFIADEKLIDTLIAIECYLPCYEIAIDEVTSVGKRITLQARARGILSGTAPEKAADSITEIPFAMGCRVEKGKITNHWFIADQLAFLKQIQ